jgi:hypothetical protein
VANSFTLAGTSLLTGAKFTLWNLPDDVTASVDWSIVDAPTGGTTWPSARLRLPGIFNSPMISDTT